MLTQALLKPCILDVRYRQTTTGFFFHHCEFCQMKRCLLCKSPHSDLEEAGWTARPQKMFSTFVGQTIARTLLCQRFCWLFVFAKVTARKKERKMSHATWLDHMHWLDKQQAMWQRIKIYNITMSHVQGKCVHPSHQKLCNQTVPVWVLLTTSWQTYLTSCKEPTSNIQGCN